MTSSLIDSLIDPPIDALIDSSTNRLAALSASPPVMATTFPFSICSFTVLSAPEATAHLVMERAARRSDPSPIHGGHTMMRPTG
jgi:hypothetical protein